MFASYIFVFYFSFLEVRLLETEEKHITLLDRPLIPSILMFSIPIVLTSWLQLIFNAADLVVVGKFGSDAVKGALDQAAIGSTSSLINFIVNLFLGFSVGVNVLVAHTYGENNKSRMTEAVRTSMFVGLASGIIVGIVGLIFATPLLRMMNTNEEVIDVASSYLRIYFIGAPFMLVYNFGSAVLRSTGDTRRPMIYLAIAGVVNVALNLFAVTVLDLGAVGVGLATTASNIISATLVTVSLLKTKGIHKLILKKFKVSTDALKEILKVGLPSGINSVMFSLSNIILQSGFNSFKNPLFIAGNSNSLNIEGFLYMFNNAFYQAAITFTSQSLGAKKPYMIKKIFTRCLLLVVTIGPLFSFGTMLFRQPLASIYSDNQTVIEYTMARMVIMCSICFIGGIMDVLTGMLRGMGHAIAPMVVSLLAICAFRVVWIYTVFKIYHTPMCLYLSYPITWAIAITCELIIFIKVYKKHSNAHHLQPT